MNDFAGYAHRVPLGWWGIAALRQRRKAKAHPG